MRLFLTFTLSTLTAMLLTTVPVAAASLQSEDNNNEYLKPDAIMLNLDNNNDGRLNYLEAMADTEIADRFLQMDLDKNGFLSLQELTVTKRMNTSQIKVLLTFASLQCI